AVLRKCNPLSLLASGGQASRMEMLDSRKDVRGQNLWVLSQFSQCGVDPRKHPRSRPMRLNIRRPFSHGALSRSASLPIWQNPHVIFSRLSLTTFEPKRSFAGFTRLAYRHQLGSLPHSITSLARGSLKTRSIARIWSAATDFGKGVVNVEPAAVEPAAPDTAADAGAKSAMAAQSKSPMDAAAQTGREQKPRGRKSRR